MLLGVRLGLSQRTRSATGPQHSLYELITEASVVRGDLEFGGGRGLLEEHAVGLGGKVGVVTFWGGGAINCDPKPHEMLFELAPGLASFSRTHPIVRGLGA